MLKNLAKLIEEIRLWLKQTRNYLFGELPHSKFAWPEVVLRVIYLLAFMGFILGIIWATTTFH